jgi:proteasome lid subunit RPN8/RPN11
VRKIEVKNKRTILVALFLIVGMTITCISTLNILSSYSINISSILKNIKPASSSNKVTRLVFQPILDMGNSNPVFVPNGDLLVFISPNITLGILDLANSNTEPEYLFEVPLLSEIHFDDIGNKAILIYHSSIEGPPDISVADIHKKTNALLALSAWGGTWTPDFSRLTYIRVVDGKEELWKMDLNGKRQIKLTSLDHLHMPEYVRWSKLGNRLFVQTALGTSIFSVISDKAVEVNEIPYAKDASWSPDGWLIVYRLKEEGFDSLWVSNLDGEDVQMVFQGVFSEVNWLPDGRLVFFTPGKEGGAACWALDPRTGSQELLADSSVVVWKPVGSIAVSPKGDALAFEAQDRQIWLLKLDVIGGQQVP